LLAHSEGDVQAAWERHALLDHFKAKRKIKLRFQKMRKQKGIRTENEERKKKKSLLPSAVAAATYRRRQNKNEQLRKDNEQKDINLHTLSNG